MRIPLFVEALTGELRRRPVERLRLILACRTAEWPTTAQEPLLSLWKLPHEECRVFELCPLRHADARMAAEACGVDAQEFMQAVYAAHVEPLAARPVTLSFLLREFQDAGRFAKTHRELYEKGAQTLCGEHDPRRSQLIRRLRKSAPISTVAQRLEAAQEIAARLLLCGQPSLEVTDSTSPEVLDAIETALFTSVGPNRFAFIHQTLAECLASQRLAKLPTLQLRRLLCRRDGGQEHVAPQLAELAAWTAGYHHQFLEHLLRIDPAVLLRSDVARIQGTHKAELVTALLKGAEREEIFDEPEYRRFYFGLSHAGLAEQLRPYIRNQGKGIIARRLAYDIAEACRLSELTDDFFAVLRDENESQQIREAASDALCESIPRDRLNELIPLARGEVGADPQDSIRGDALKKLIPAVWTVREALPTIHAPRNRNFVGSYEMLLRYHLPACLTEEDVAPVLDRLSEWQNAFDSLNSRQTLAEKVFCMGLTRLNEPEIAEKMVRIWIAKSRAYHPFERGKDSKIREALEDDAKRRGYAARILNSEQTTETDLYHLLSSDEWGILKKDDLPWLLEALDSVSADRLSIWILVVRDAVWWWMSGSCWDLFMARRSEIPQLEVAFPLYSEINSPASRAAKARYLCDQRRRRRFDDHRKPKPPLDAKRRIANDLRLFHSGRTDAWYRMFYDLSLAPGDVQYQHLRTSVVEMPGWKAASDSMREEFREAARAFLLNHNDGYAKFGGPSNSADPGFHAIELLKDEVLANPALRAMVSANWIGAITGWYSDDDMREKELFALAYAINPEATIAGLLREAQKDHDGHGHIFAFRRAQACWDARLSKVAIDFIEGCTKAESIGSGICELADLDAPAAEECVIRLLGRYQRDSSLRECLVEVMAAAISKKMSKAWNGVMEVLSQDDDLACTVLLQAAQDLDRGGQQFFVELTEVQIANFYLLIARLFPPKKDPPLPSGRVTTRQSAMHMRGALLTALAARANKEACDQFLRLATERPEEATWFRWKYRDTLTAKRRSEWSPQPQAIVEKLIADPQSRLINDEDDLLELIVESLERLQTYLRRQNNPAVEDLWNCDGGGNQRTNFRPKDEEFISDYAARWLERDIARSGIVVNREVQPIRGRRTDILVQAVLPLNMPSRQGEESSINVTIEVKGCWNSSVPTAVETQLVGEYLRPFGRTRGLYLVAWFVCPQWQGYPPRCGSSLGVQSVEDARERVERLCEPYNGKHEPAVVRGIVLDARLNG